jgi:hypothetical protein
MKTFRFPLLVLACGALMAASCSDPPPRPDATGIGTGSSDLLGPIVQNLGLLSCDPLTADTVSQVVGAGGGVINIGPHTLEIPAGALTGDVTITVVLPPDTVNVLYFEPHGLEFATPARVYLSYSNCDLLGSLLPRRVAYTSDQLSILEYVPSLDLLLTQRVRGSIDHFSGYAVAW